MNFDIMGSCISGGCDTGESQHEALGYDELWERIHLAISYS